MYVRGIVCLSSTLVGEFTCNWGFFIVAMHAVDISARGSDNSQLQYSYVVLISRSHGSSALVLPHPKPKNNCQQQIKGAKVQTLSVGHTYPCILMNIECESHGTVTGGRPIEKPLDLPHYNGVTL